MFRRFVARGAISALLAMTLTGAGASAAPPAPTPGDVVRVDKIAVPGKPLRAFDISWVDSASGRYYLADRSNASIDIFDSTSNQVLGQIGGFKGATGNNDTSGPDGVVVSVSRRELWAGDGDSTVKMIDLTTGKIAASVSTGGKFRADELAFDPKDSLILIANDADEPPFLTFISTSARSVVKKIEFPNATMGLEQPVYDPVGGMFYQAVPQTTANAGGEVAVLDPSTLSVVKSFVLPNCVPHGMALGPGNQLLAGCVTAGRSVIIDKTNGVVLADFSDNGGSDEVWFNPGDNRYYLAQTAAQNLGVIDAASLTTLAKVETGIGAHSAAADLGNNHVFVPIAGPDPACPTGCIAVFSSSNVENKGLPRTF
jgi:DNA-binding beta-propeller fold protein YncE